MTTFEFEAIGTHWHIDIADTFSSSQEKDILEQVMIRIGVFDKAYSRFRSDSLVTEMSHSGAYTLPDDAKKMMELYEQVFRLTDGKVTPLIGQVLVDAGYDAVYSLAEKPLTTLLSWDEVMAYEYPILLLKQPALLDFGAAGKGYLVDIVGEVLEENGIASYLVDAGGDIRHRSVAHESARIGLEHPVNKDEVIGVATISNHSICGSAGNRRAWGEYHHIIDPDKLASPRHILAVWIVAETTILADILSTAIFFTSPEVLCKHFKFEYLILGADYIVEKSDGFLRKCLQAKML